MEIEMEGKKREIETENIIVQHAAAAAKPSYFCNWFVRKQSSAASHINYLRLLD